MRPFLSLAGSRGDRFNELPMPPPKYHSHLSDHVLLLVVWQLFRNAGVSQRLYDGFLEPMLLVLPMCPGEDCSAAAALSCFQYFALEHQVSTYIYLR